MTPNRIVVLLTPIFAAISGLIAGYVSDLLPGADLNQAELTAAFVAGALAAATAVNQWLRGWQKHEERDALFSEVEFDDALPVRIDESE